MKKCKLIIIAIILFLITIKVEAQDMTVEIKCPSESIAGQSISCPVTISEFTGTIYGIKFNYDISDKLSYDSFVPVENGNNVIINDQEGLEIIYLNGITNDAIIGNLNLLVKYDAEMGKSYNIGLANINVTDGTTDFYTTATSKVTIVGEETIVSSMSINAQELEIKNGISNYSFAISEGIGEVVIDAKLNDGYSFVDGYGPRSITGDNLIGEHFVKVKKDDNTILTYRINVKLDHESMMAGDNVDNPSTGDFSMGTIVIVTIVLTSLAIIAAKRLKSM